MISKNFHAHDFFLFLFIVVIVPDVCLKLSFVETVLLAVSSVKLELLCKYSAVEFQESNVFLKGRLLLCGIEESRKRCVEEMVWEGEVGAFLDIVIGTRVRFQNENGTTYSKKGNFFPVKTE